MDHALDQSVRMLAIPLTTDDDDDDDDDDDGVTRRLRRMSLVSARLPMTPLEYQLRLG